MRAAVRHACRATGGPGVQRLPGYYLNLYLSELGTWVCNLVVGWPEVGWKMIRPVTSNTVQGTFGLRLDPIPTMAHGDRYTSCSATGRNSPQPPSRSWMRWS